MPTQTAQTQSSKKTKPDNVCSWGDCTLEEYAKGMCRIHYTRHVRSNGDPAKMNRPMKAAAGAVPNFLPTVRISDDVHNAITQAGKILGVSRAVLVRRILEDWADDPWKPEGHVTREELEPASEE